MANDYRRVFKPLTRRATVPELVLELLAARSQNCLPAEQMTAAEQVSKVKVKNDDDVSVFTPAEMRTILHAAPPHLIPILAVGAFSGIRMAELNRLDWSAFDLDRGIIELRAGQAKTASRRIIPITENLRAWIEPLPRKGKVVRTVLLHREVTALARALKMEWPRNVLRHSFISYRIAKVKSADQVALEAGNSPSIIFKNYRELATEEQADEWFASYPRRGSGRTATSGTTGPESSRCPVRRNPEPSVQSARQRCLTDAEWFCEGRPYCHPLRGRHVLLRGTKRKIRGMEEGLHTPDL